MPQSLKTSFRKLTQTCTKPLKILFTGLLAYLLFSPVPSFGQGDLLISPRRVVFEGSKRSIDLNLANTGKDTSTYAISLIQIRMKEDGGFETITEPDPGQRFADRYIRFFPRTVVLGPNEAQTVKVQLIRTSVLTPGEYRSHFYFRSIPKMKPLGEKEPVRDTTAISVRLTPVFGITIPVIVRIGESTAKVTLSDLSLTFDNDTLPRISMVFHRTGNMSVYGDLTVDHISTQGKITRVGFANGVAVYTPNERRRFQFNLNRMPGVDFKSGTLRVIYSAPSDVSPVRFTEAELSLQ
ncbi:MAG: molecular chaperone [Bacteroidota bacterium]|nr:molecular chaperone [Bacteroidota bacterium]